MNQVSPTRQIDLFPQVLDIELSQASPCHICAKDNRLDSCSYPLNVTLPPFRNYKDIVEYPCELVRDKTISEFYANTVMRTFAIFYNKDHPDEDIDPEVFIDTRAEIYKQKPNITLLKKIADPKYKKFLQDFLDYVTQHETMGAQELVIDIIQMFMNFRVFAFTHCNDIETTE